MKRTAVYGWGLGAVTVVILLAIQWPGVMGTLAWTGPCVALVCAAFMYTFFPEKPSK